MSTTLKKTLAGVALAALLAFGASTVSAQSIADLQAMIASLQAQLAALAGGSSSCAAYNHTVTLKQGSSGSQVSAMQAVIGATADGKFGPMTKAKVQAFQASHGLVADGIVGPNTGASIHAASMTNCGSTGNTGNNGNTSGPLQGGAGFLKSTTPTVLSQYNNEDVGEGQNDVIVAGWELEADKGSDLKFTSLRIKFDGTSNTGSKTLKKYADEVSVWMDGKEVARLDVSDFSKDSTGIYSTAVNLSNAILRAGKKGKLTIAVSAQNTIDSTDLSGDAWTVDVETIRYQDASGAILTDTLTITPVAMDFVSFSSAADTELKISKATDSPTAGIVIINESTSKDNLLLLKGKIRLEGDSDVNIDSLPVTLTLAGGDVITDVASTLTLILDGEEFSEAITATTSGTTSATITFDDLDFDLESGDSVNFEIRVDVEGTDDHGQGDSLTAAITSDNRSAIDVENDEGDQLDDSDKTGTAVGEAQEFRSSGVSLSFVSATESSNADGTLGTFTIKFKVAAIGDDVYVGTVANSSKYGITVEAAGSGATTAGVSHAITNNGGNGNSVSTTTGGNWKVLEGTEATFTIQSFVAGSSAAAGAYRSVLSSMYWSTDDTDAITTTDNSYSSNMEQFHTDYVQLL